MFESSISFGLNLLKIWRWIFMENYTINRAAREGLLRPGDEILVVIQAANTHLKGYFQNPVFGLDIGNFGNLFKLYGNDIVLEVNGTLLG